MDLKRI